MNLNILGTEYVMHMRKLKEDERLEQCDGYFEPYSKEIVVETDFKDDIMKISNIEEFQRKVKRHEILHAFLHESGLAENSEWGRDETLVDWIAIQFPKMLEVFRQAEAL